MSSAQRNAIPGLTREHGAKRGVLTAQLPRDDQRRRARREPGAGRGGNRGRHEHCGEPQRRRERRTRRALRSGGEVSDERRHHDGT
jgi:hypothetical protein